MLAVGTVIGPRDIERRSMDYSSVTRTVIFVVSVFTSYTCTQSDAFADPPTGVRVVWANGYTSTARGAQTLIPFGASTSQTNLFLSDGPSEDLPKCYGAADGKGLCSFLRSQKLKGWFPDFGEDAPPWAFTLEMSFLNDKFYKYLITFPELQYLVVRTALDKTLGKPTMTTPLPLRNGFGASIDAKVFTWETKSAEVTLTFPSPADLNEGMLIVSYKPIAKNAPKIGDRAKAPF